MSKKKLKRTYGTSAKEYYADVVDVDVEMVEVDLTRANAADLEVLNRVLGKEGQRATVELHLRHNESEVLKMVESMVAWSDSTIKAFKNPIEDDEVNLNHPDMAVRVLTLARRMKATIPDLQEAMRVEDAADTAFYMMLLMDYKGALQHLVREHERSIGNEHINRAKRQGHSEETLRQWAVAAVPIEEAYYNKKGKRMLVTPLVRELLPIFGFEVGALGTPESSMKKHFLTLRREEKENKIKK